MGRCVPHDIMNACVVCWVAYKSKCKDSVSLFSLGHKFGSVWTTQPTIALDCSKKKKMLICLSLSDILGFTFFFFFFFPFSLHSCIERNFKVHPLQNLSYMIERFIQMSVILLWVLSQQDPVAPQISRKSTVNFSVPWWLSVCTVASFFGNIL